MKKLLPLLLLLLLAPVTVAAQTPTPSPVEVARATVDRMGERFADSLIARAATLAAVQFNSKLGIFTPLSSDPVACASAYERLAYYSMTSHALKICNGTSWQTVATGGASVTANPATNTVPYLSAANTYSDSIITTSGTGVGINLGAAASPTMFTVGDTTSATPRGLMSWQASNDAASAHLHMRKSRGTFAAPLTIVTADVLGRLVFSAYEGSAYNESAYIRAVSTGTIAATRVPSKLEFFTSTDAAPSVATLAFTLNADQTAVHAKGVTITSGALTLTGSSSGATTIQSPAAAGAAVVTMPDASSTLPIYGAQMTYTGPTAPRTVTYPDASFTVARTDAANTFTGHQTIEGVTSTGATGTQLLVFGTSPSLTTPTLGVAAATSINKVAITAPATSATLTIANGKTLTANNTISLSGTDSTTITFPATSATVARTDAGQTFTGQNIFTSPKILTDFSDTNGNELLKVTATASAVNELTLANAATGNAPVLSASGDDANVGMTFTPKGTGKALVKPTGAATTLFEVQDSSANSFLQVNNNSSAVLFRNNLLDLSGSGNNFTVVGSSGRILVANAGSVEFRASSGGSVDVALMRSAAGVLESNTGTIGTFRDLKVRQHYVDATNTAAGTTGNQTINKAAGTVNVAATGTAVTVTNSLVTANSLVFTTLRTNDATCRMGSTVPAAGSFTINLTAGCAAEVSIGFLVINQ